MGTLTEMIAAITGTRRACTRNDWLSILICSVTVGFFVRPKTISRSEFFGSCSADRGAEGLEMETTTRLSIEG